MERTQVAIIGGGPSGLLLAQLLHHKGIDTVVLEHRTRAHVLSRIRAGILETGLVSLLHEAGAGKRLARESFIHDGTMIARHGEMFRVSFGERTGRRVVVYGQTELTRDLYAARDECGAATLFEIDDVEMEGLEGSKPLVNFAHEGRRKTLACDFIAGCDGFHGVSRKTIPAELRREHEKVYPFGWLGVLSETPPVHEELVYSASQRGFALCSMRNENLSRYYIQCPITDRPENWSDDAFWDELRRRIPEQQADTLVTGPSIEKSIAPLRSFVCEPMQHGRLFLCGDAAHIVPPTGAKGLNTAASDVHYLKEALVAHYQHGDDSLLDSYSQRALSRIWKAERFSWWMTMMLHRFDDSDEFDTRMQQAEFELLRDQESAQRLFAENYAGLPY